MTSSMTEKKYQAYRAAAQSLGDTEKEYALGYARGIQRFYFGEVFGTDQEHQQCLALEGSRQERGDGYRDGFAGKPPRGHHANLGNQHAAGGEADEYLHVRLPSAKKAAYKATAKRQNKTLSEWVIQNLDPHVK